MPEGNILALASMSAGSRDINSFGKLLRMMQWKPLHLMANRLRGCSVWALAPFCVCFGFAVCFVSPLAKRKSGWGICGSSFFVVFCGCVLV